MEHLIKILILLFAVTLVTGKPMLDDWSLVWNNDKGAWTDEGDIKDLSSVSREYINSESDICCRLRLPCCRRQ